MPQDNHPLVSVLMGSKSDWDTMRAAVDMLDELRIPNEARAISAHRALDALLDYIADAERAGVKVIIAGAGGAAHLPGVIAAKTTLPVLGVPMESKSLKGLDSLLSIVQMPAGIPVGTFAIGLPGAKNAALFAAAILALSDQDLRARLQQFRSEQTQKVLATKLD